MDTTFFIRELEAVYTTKTFTEQKQITCSKDVFKNFSNLWAKDINIRERFYVMCLNNSNEIVAYSLISVGGITATSVDLRIIFQNALLSNSVAIIIAHNHPSGKLTPSEIDKNITNKIKKAGEVLDIKLLDHLIITENSYLSFADECLL